MGWSWLLIARSSNRTVKVFSHVALYKGQVWPFPSFHAFFSFQKTQSQTTSPFFPFEPYETPRLLFAAHSFDHFFLFFMPSTVLQLLPRRLRGGLPGFFYGGAQDFSCEFSSSSSVRTFCRKEVGPLILFLSFFFFDSFLFLIHFSPCMSQPLGLFEVASLCHYIMAVDNDCRS